MSESYSADYITSALHADRTERLFVEAAAQHDRDGIYVDMGAAYGWLPAAAARDLGAWLAKRYGLAPYKATDGEAVRVVSNGSDTFGGVTRATVVDSEPDCDGEIKCRALDGSRVGDTFYVTPDEIRHPAAILSEDAKPATPTTTLHPVGTPLIVTFSGPTLHGPKLPVGTPVVVKAHGATGSTYVVSAFIDGAITERRVRAQDVAPTMPAATATPAVLKVGDVVDLKPNAKTAGGGHVFFSADVTRVKVFSGPDGAGDYYVERVNGSGTRTQHVGRAYLGDPEATPAPTIEVGREYRLLPGARARFGTSEPLFDATRVQVERGPDSDGDVWVKLIDGPGAARRFAYVLPRYLAPLDEARPWAVGDEAIVTSDRPHGAQIIEGDRVKIESVAPGGDGRMVARVRRVAGGAVWSVYAEENLRRP